MNKEQALQELYSYMTPEDGAMVPIGYVDNLINKIYEEALDIVPKLLEDKYKLGYCQGYSDKSVDMEPIYNIKDLE